MDIYDSNGIKLEYSTVLADLPITESCEHVEEMMKADHIVLSWRDSEKYTLPVGAYITYKGVNYALLEPYSPEQKSDDEFEYTPNFQHPKMYLGKVPFRFPTTDTEGNSITLLEWPYSGDLDTLLTFFCRTMESVLGLAANTFNYSILGEIDAVVSTNFNSVDILSALSNVANVLKCEWHIDWDYKILYFGHIELSRDEVNETVLEVGVNVGTPSVRSSKEGFYNTYEPQGSTRNISKRAASGEYVQGDVRLALNETDYPDKVIYTNESGTVIASLPQGVKKYVKPLIFDNIYPKLDLYVYDVRCRERYLLDEDGNKIVDHYDGSTPVYKRYAVWYMRLAYPTKADGHVTAWNNYAINPDTDIISGKNLGGAFQPNTYEGAESFPLAGRGKAEDGGYGFELHYHTTAEVIPANPTDGDTGVEIKAGDYEIVFQEQNDYILPTTASQGIIPKGVKVNGQEVTDLNSLTNLDDGQKGNIVDLYNIVIGNDSRYYESAQSDLAQETLKYITNQFKDNNSYTLKSDVVAFKKRIDQDELLHIDSSLYIGQKVTYKNGDYELETRVMKLTTKLDYAFEQEIVVGNEVLKGAQTTLKEQVQTILSGGTGNGSGGGVDASAVRKIIQAYVNPRFLSKISDDTAQGFLTLLQGLQIGANFDGDNILGEGGVLRMNNDGKVELVVDILYARMRAYFDSVVIREYKHESGNRVVSPAQGFNASRVEYIKVVNNEETIVTTPGDADYFRCYWRVDDGEKKTENQFVIGDLAFCEHSDIVNGTLVTKRYWRVVRGRNAGNTTTADGEAWIDLSNAHDANGAPVMTTITWEGQGGTTQTLSVKSFESATNAYPEVHDDICMLGCVVDSTRRGAIIEYVSGTNAPTYQIYQGLGADATNPYTLENKNQISIGYNSATGKADMKVYGDAYIGDRNRTTFIEYKQDDGTQQHAPVLNIKAVMQTLPSSTYEGKTASQFVQDNQIKYDNAIQNLTNITNDLQSQIDGQVETFFYNGTPSDSVLPESEWKAIDIATGNNNERLKHLSDLYYDNQTGYAYRYSNSGTEENPVFFWNPISDSAVIKALTDAAAAYGLANTKAKTFTTASNTLPSPPYKTGDLWLNATGTWGSGDAAVTWNGDILKVKANINRASGDTPLISDWELAGNYLNEQDFLDWKVGQYATDLTNAANNYLNDAVANAIKSALGSALGASTLTDGGLMLTSLIYLRKLNAGGDPTHVSDYTTWGGVSGEYDANAAGGGIAAWYGGNPVDKEVLQPDEPWDGTHHYRWARSLFRFDGSGYLADGNITWTAAGSMTIRNLTTIYGSQGGGVDVNTLSSLTSIFNTETYGTDPNTELLVKPQNAFSELFINRSGTAHTGYPTDKSICDYSVLNFGEMKERFLMKDWFSQFFVAHYKQNNVDKTLAPNAEFPNDATDKTLESVFSFWTNYGLTALGRGIDGTHVVGVLDDLNDVTITNPQENQVLAYNGQRWVNAAAPETYVLPQATSGALGGIKIGYSASGKNYAVVLDNGKAYVNVPWTDHYAWSDITNKPLTLTKNTTGFSISGGTTSKTLTVSESYTLGAACAKGVTDNSSATAVTSSDTNLITGRTLYYAGYVKSSGVTSVATGTGLTGGTITGTGTISINSTYQTYISHGESAYNSLSNYLPLSGGNVTGLLAAVRGSVSDYDTTVIANSAALSIGIENNDAVWIGFKTNTEGFIQAAYAGNSSQPSSSYIYGLVLQPIGGNVGIGKSASYKLDVNGDVRATNFRGALVGNADSATTATTATSATTATTASKLSTVSKTAWGKTFWTSSGVPDSISGDMSSVGNISFSASGKNIGSILYFDTTNSCLGIGVSSPSYKLHVDGVAKVSYIRIGESVDQINCDSALHLQYANTTSGMSLCGQGGNVGVGTTSPQYNLHVNGSFASTTAYISSYLKVETGDTHNISDDMHSAASMCVGEYEDDALWIGRINAGSIGFIQCSYKNASLARYALSLQPRGGNVGIQTTAPSYALHVAGDIYATGGVTSLSDIRKKNVVSYELPLNVEQIANAPTIKFLWKDNREEGEQVGTIAQYWEKVLPESIKDKSGELSMSYGVASLISTIVTARKVMNHEKRITELEKECARLRTENELLRTKIVA